MISTRSWSRRGLRFVRYADDFLVFTKTSEAARRVLRFRGTLPDAETEAGGQSAEEPHLQHRWSRVSRLYLPRLRRPDSRQPEEYPEVQGPRKRDHASQTGRVDARRCKELRQYLHGWMGISVWYRSKASSANWTSGSAAAFVAVTGSNGATHEPGFETKETGRSHGKPFPWQQQQRPMGMSRTDGSAHGHHGTYLGNMDW